MSTQNLLYMFIQTKVNKVINGMLHTIITLDVLVNLTL